MNKIVVKSCPCIANAYYADGRKEKYECSSMDSINIKCEDKEDCSVKMVVRNLMKVISNNLCSNCDGCGYSEGCTDINCGTYQAYKCLEILDIKEI